MKCVDVVGMPIFDGKDDMKLHMFHNTILGALGRMS